MKPSMTNIEHLLPLYMQGALADQEDIALVERWIEESEEHRQEANRFFKLYFAGDVERASRTLRAKRDFRRASRRMSGRRPSLRIAWVSWAAAVAVALVVQHLFLTRENSEPFFITVSANAGAITTLTLPDSTRVHLNAESRFSYPDRFSKDERTVILDGEGYFEVAKESDRPFIVRTPHDAEVAVYGTRFNLDAYGESKKVSVSLEEGRVGFRYTRGNGESDERILTPGQKLKYDVSTRSVSVCPAYVEGDIAWKDGKIMLRDTPLKDALQMLSRRFNVDFDVKNSDFEHYAFTFTGSFNKLDLNDILDYFLLSSQIKHRYVSTDPPLGETKRVELY
jgi:ferric-dicitrate binding protein FerR (iron transport regulator)